IVAQESARPYFEYNSFYSVEQASGRQSKGKAEADVNVPSPLLIESTPFVTLHFQINPQGQFNSPEAPQGKLVAFACPDYLSEDQWRGNSAKLETCEGIVNTRKLLESLPEPGLAASMAAIPIQVAAQNGRFSAATNAFANGPNGTPPINQAQVSPSDANPDTNGLAQQPDSGQPQTAVHAPTQQPPP